MGMARETFELIIDDLDGTRPAQTYTFALSGQTYTIDLNEENFQSLVDALEPFIAVAKRGDHTVKVYSNGRRSKAYMANMREWARENGFEVSERGKVPKAVERAYVDHLAETQDEQV